MTVSWTPSTDNVGVTAYRIERCQGSGCTAFAQIGTATTTSYSNTGLAGTTSYSYRVRATDAAGNLSAYSNTATATTPSDVSVGLVAAFGFEEGTGSTTADASGNGNTGTISGATWTTQGRFGQALSFNGSSSRVSVAAAASLNLGAAMTLEGWIYPTAAQRRLAHDPPATDECLFSECEQQHRATTAVGRRHVRDDHHVCQRHHGQSGQYLDARGGDLRRRDAAVVRQVYAGGQSATDGHPPGVDQPVVDRRQ